MFLSFFLGEGNKKAVFLHQYFFLFFLQGRAVYGCELRIVDDKGEVLPNDGKTAGRLQVRGPWVLSQYHG